jgi:hypothetical protein
MDLSRYGSLGAGSAPKLPYNPLSGGAAGGSAGAAGAGFMPGPDSWESGPGSLSGSPNGFGTKGVMVGVGDVVGEGDGDKDKDGRLAKIEEAKTEIPGSRESKLLRREVEHYNLAYDAVVNQHRKILPPPSDDPREAFLRFKREAPGFPYGILMMGIAGAILSAFFSLAHLGLAFWGASMGLFVLSMFLLIPAFSKIDIWKADNLKREELIDSALEGHYTAIEEFMGEILSEIDWVLETSASYEVSRDGNFVSIDVNLPEIEDLESDTLVARNAKSGVTKVPKNPWVIQREYQLMVHAIILRIAGEVFYHFPTIRKVLVSGYTDRIHPATGLAKSEYVISVIFNRELWLGIAPSQADPVECIGLFAVRRDIGEDSFMKPIEPFVPE